MFFDKNQKVGCLLDAVFFEGRGDKHLLVFAKFRQEAWVRRLEKMFFF